MVSVGKQRTTSAQGGGANAHCLGAIGAIVFPLVCQQHEDSLAGGQRGSVLSAAY